MEVSKIQHHKQQLAFYLEQITKIILNCKNNPRIDFYEQLIAIKAIQKTLPQAIQNLIFLHNTASTAATPPDLQEAQQALRSVTFEGPSNEPTKPS